MKTKLLFILPLFLLFSFVSCNEDDTMGESEAQFKSFNKPGDETIFGIVAGFLPGQFSQLYAAIQYVDEMENAGLEDAIKSNDLNITVFAPTDQSFVNLLGVLDGLRENETIDDIRDVPSEIVLAVLQYHLTNGRRGSNSVVPRKGMKSIQTFLPGASFKVNKDLEITDIANIYDPKPLIGAGNPGNFANISASNGMIHVIDAVLLPIGPDELNDLWDSLIE